MLEPKRSDDQIVARGQAAWERLKEDTPKRRALSRGTSDKAIERREQSQTMHRRWWLDVGHALAVGRRLNKIDRIYSHWLRAHGFEDIYRKARPSAIWFAENVEALGDIPDGMAHPTVIRQWATTQKAVSSRRAAVSTTMGDGRHKTIDGPLSAADAADLQEAVRLLRQAADHSRRSLKAIEAAVGLVYCVNVAIKRRGGP